MSKKSDLQATAKELGIEGTETMSVSQLDQAISASPTEEKKPKTFDIEGNEIKEPVQADPEKEKEEMITLSLNGANNFMQIVSAVMIDDVRGEVILKHFTKLLVKYNPHLTQEQKK